MNNQPINAAPVTPVNAPAAVPAAPAQTAVPAAAASPAVPATSGDGMSIASFILGLISVIFLPLGTLPGFLGFALSLDAKRRGSRHSLLTAGRVLSIIGMVAIPALYLLLMLFTIGMSAMML